MSAGGGSGSETGLWTGGCSGGCRGTHPPGSGVRRACPPGPALTTSRDRERSGATHHERGWDPTGPPPATGDLDPVPLLREDAARQRQEVSLIPPALVGFLTRLLWVLLYRQRGIWVARVVGFALGLVVGSALLRLRVGLAW